MRKKEEGRMKMAMKINVYTENENTIPYLVFPPIFVSLPTPFRQEIMSKLFSPIGRIWKFIYNK